MEEKIFEIKYKERDFEEFHPFRETIRKRLCDK